MKSASSLLPSFILICLTGLLIAAPIGLAEDVRGRLPDGRAFRTDAEGNQLVDYIAELELNVEALSRQVRGLEDEVAEKQARLMELQSGKAAPKLVEKDLGSDIRPAAINNADVCTPQIKGLTDELEAARADLEVERGVNAQKVAALTSELATAKEQLAIKSKEVEALQASFSEADGRAEEALAILAREKKEAEAARAELARQQENRTVVAASSLGNERSSLSSSRMRAVESVRGNLNTSLKEVRSLIATRNDLYKRYSATKRSVAFTPSRAESNRGLTLDRIAKELGEASTVGQLSQLSKDLSDIRRKMQEDIGLMKRVGRL